MFEENIIIGCDEPFVFDERYLTWNQDSIRNNTNAVPFTSDIWTEAYPELKTLMEDEPGAPKYNIIRNNVSMDSPGYRLYDTVKQYALEIKDDVSISKKDFVDFAGGDLNLKQDSSVFKKIPEFTAIDFDAIGVQEKTEREKTLEDVMTGSVVLKLMQPEAFVFGNQTVVDPDNKEVSPVLEDDRTLVPVRFITESFGETVGWDAETAKVTLENGENHVELLVGQTEMTVNGQTVALDVPAKIVRGRTMLPLRAVAEALGKNVYWDESGLIVLSSETFALGESEEMTDGLIRLFE